LSDPSWTPVYILSFRINQVDMGKLSLALLSPRFRWAVSSQQNLLHGSINCSFVPQIAVFKANRRDRTLSADEPNLFNGLCSMRPCRIATTKLVCHAIMYVFQ
jgi:hypothetical protein